MKTRSRIVAGTVLLVAALGLSGCANPIEQLVNKGVEQALEGAIGGTDGKVDLNTGDGASLPADWPSEIPTPNGEVQFSVAADKGFMVTFIADKAEVDSALQKLSGAGFTEEGNIAAGDSRVISMKNDSWTVGITVTKESGGDRQLMAYIVAPA